MGRSIVRHGARMVVMTLAVLALASCMATQGGGDAAAAASPGFWRGLWHGLIAPVAFIASLFSETIRIYAAPNAGRWYDFGYMLGIGGFSGGIFAGHRTRTVKKTYVVETS